MLAYHVIILFMLVAFLALVLRNLKDYACPKADERPSHPDDRLILLIPARNEAENIGACLDGFLNQTWERFMLFVLDDGSDDGTDLIVKGIAAKDSRVRLLRGKPLPEGWAGKVWACHQLGEAALEAGADWLLFVDADTRAKPELVGASLALAQRWEAGMLSTFPYQVTGSVPERVVLPLLHFLIVTFLPVRMVWESPISQIVAACGQFELFHADAYRAVGGHGSIPGSFHDGLQLARRVKAGGRSVRLFDGSALISCHMYSGGLAVWRGFTRNAYEGLGSMGALIVMTLLQGLLFLFPYFWLAWSLARALGGGGFPIWGWLCAAQVMLIVIMRALQARRFGHPEATLLHPISIIALIAIQWASFFNRGRRNRVIWKGRVY